ncbi:RidA family protein, partial [Campylobacter coli]|nr:RidA family protein [Campylobacter coli]
MIKYVYLIYINKKGEKMSNYPKAIGPYS